MAYTDTSICTDLENCADTQKAGGAMMPDIGSYMKMLELSGYKSINIGKQTLSKFDEKIKFVVGDSLSSDGVLADKLSVLFIHVNQNCQKPFVDIDNQRIVITSIKDLN